MNSIEIVVPIYNAVPDVRKCLDALQRHTPAIARVWLVDDASTDKDIAALLDTFDSRAHFDVRVLRNSVNLGFIGSVNRVLAQVKGDVLLLNSDAIITDGAVLAIARAAEAVPNAASITPWSNNAEICSFPNFCVNNSVPENLSERAQACMTLTPTDPDLPTGVGFCMYMSQLALRRIGLFDAATFGRGYGEENDWCRRAAGFGMRNILCDNAFVAHTGGRSFAETGETPGGENLRRLVARYPSYHESVSQFISADPLAANRARLRSALTQIKTQNQ